MRHTLTFLILAACVGTGCQRAVPAAPEAPTQAEASAASPSPSPRVSGTPLPPSPTPGPGPRTFKDEFDGDLSRWSFVEVDNGSAAPDPRLSAGYLRFDLTAANQWLYALYSSQTYTDVRIDAAVSDGSESGATGVLCRYSRNAGWYEFNVYPDQTYVLSYGQWLAPGVARFTPLVRSQSPKIQPTENDIGLVCKGNILTPYINGVQMRQRVETTYGLTAGNVGVAAASFETAPMSILVDWAQVTEP